MGGGGGGGKKQKKIHARENSKKKNSFKEEGKEKNSCRRKVNCDFFKRSEFLSESLIFRNQQYYQGQYE